MAKTDKLKFEYTAKHKITGEFVEKKAITATSIEAVEKFLYQQGYTPYEVISKNGDGLNTELSFGFKKKSVKPRELALFCRRFAVMQDAGVPVKRILETLSKGKDTSPVLAEALHDIVNSINAGESLSDGFANHPGIFSELMINMIRAGESGGFLDATFEQIATNTEKEVKLRSKIKSAMTYPIVVFAMAILMCMGMLLFIVPIFDTMFKSLGGKLPLPTQILVYASDGLKVGIIPLVIVTAIIVMWWKKNKHKMWIRNIKDPLMLKIPVVGLLTGKIIIGRFSRNFSTLLKSGVPILNSLDIVAGTVGSVVVTRALQSVKQSISQGDTIADPLSEHAVFPDMVVEMIRVGEDTGKIPPMLEKIADTYDDDVEATTDALTSLIEPLMIVFLGAIVGTMIIALYMPIFSVYDLVK
jgi:type IV pilus assembly protein PilC